jgi:hypothetical protein
MARHLRLIPRQNAHSRCYHIFNSARGRGKFSFRAGRKQAPDDAAYHQALELFVAEEQTHARLLEQLVHYFGGGTIKRHWTHALFGSRAVLSV